VKKKSKTIIRKMAIGWEDLVDAGIIPNMIRISRGNTVRDEKFVKVKITFEEM